MPGGGAIAIVLAGLWLLGVVLVYPVPPMSVVLFGGAGLLGLMTGVLSGISNLILWGAASWLLALMSVFGWLEQRNSDRRDRELRARLANPISTLGGSFSQRLMARSPPSRRLPRCGFCGAVMEAERATARNAGPRALQRGEAASLASDNGTRQGPSTAQFIGSG